ncbi:MAG: transketolase family protein [Oscillospiraceae bacterium]|jgi:transketolase|nr:transketolase family protein [Oscillospiraceae bacterium]
MIQYDKISSRDAFGNALLRIAEENPLLVGIGADTTKSMGMQKLSEKYPERVINIGIAEQNMTAVAAGMAATGFQVYAASYAPFSTLRAAEQVRTFIAYPNLDVKIVGGLGGLSGNIEGVTHQGLEDVAVMRSIPNMTVVIPADAASTEVITEEIARIRGPVYLRLGRGAVEKVFDAGYRFQIGKANVLKADGSDAAIICNGAVVARALRAAQLLDANGVKARVIEMPCVKPIDADAVVESAAATGAVITVEEHNIIGGLGSAVAEVLGGRRPSPLLRIGIEDIFTESAPHNDLLDRYGFRPEDMAARIGQFLSSFNSKNEEEA